MADNPYPQGTLAWQRWNAQNGGGQSSPTPDQNPAIGKNRLQQNVPKQTQDSNPAQQWRDSFSNQPYAQTQGFQDLLNNFTSDTARANLLGSDQGVSQGWQGIIQGWANNFSQQFQNLAGRPPNAAEYNTFFQQVINPTSPWLKNPDQAQVNTGITGLLQNTFSGDIANAQQQKAQDQATAATAPGSAFDVWQQGLTQSVNSLDQQLQDYQSRLFEKIRPQLLTSLQSQGLLNSGALNEAFAGANADLTNTAQGYIANAKLGAAQNIANQKYAIQSSPSNFALQNTFNTIPNLTQSGQTALQNSFSNYMNTNLANLNYENQLGLYEAYNQNQPSLLSQYGGQILGGAAAGLAGRKW